MVQPNVVNMIVEIGSINDQHGARMTLEAYNNPLAVSSPCSCSRPLI